MTAKRDLPEIDGEYLQARCAACDGCLLWKGRMKDHQPYATINKRMWKIRNVVWQLAGKRIPKGRVVKMKCGEERCLIRSHMELQVKNEQERGRKRSLAVRRANALQQQARSRLTVAAIDEVRNSDVPLVEVARKHQISTQWASQIRQGLAWRDFSSPFTQLLR